MLPLLLACTSGKPEPTDTAQRTDSVDSTDTADSADTVDSADSAETGEKAGTTLTAVDPALGDTLGGVRVTLTGDRLADVSEVTFGGAPCVTAGVASDATLQCIAPALAAGTYDVVVTSPTGTATLPAAWEAWSPSGIPGARVYNASTGITLDAEVAPLWLWTQEATSAPWHPRDGAGLVWFDDKLWLLGGWDGTPVPGWHDQRTTNEVWSSDDLGATWTQELADVVDPPTTGPDARWLPRHTAGWLTHVQDGVPYLYVIGGDIYHVVGDVWRSTDGVTWEEVAANTPWEGRVLQMAASYAGDLYVMGGQIDINAPSTALNDVWRSEDGGATWTQLPDAPWAPRGMTYNPVELDGKLWLIGGGTYDDAPRTFYNDVWSFDGTTWTEVLPDGAAPWMGREYHNTYAADGELWVSSGYGADAQNHNDFWRSADGVTWTEVTGSPMTPGHADGVAVTPYGIVHASGNALDTEVFRLIATTGAPLSTWTNGTGLDLTAEGADTRPLLIQGAFGDQDGVWLNGETAWLQLSVWDAQPAGRSVFWVGRTQREVAWSDYVNPSMTVIGDSHGSCRDQAGYSGDQIELVVTDATGAWSGGHVLRGEGITDNAVHLVGFTHAADGTVTAYIDGAPAGDPVVTSYDGAHMGWDLVGAGYAYGSRAKVMLGLVVVAPSVLTAEDLDKLAQFARKWGG